MLQVVFLPIDKWRRFILQNPELYLGGVAEPFWLNSLGAAVWVGEQVLSVAESRSILFCRVD